MALARLLKELQDLQQAVQNESAIFREAWQVAPSVERAPFEASIQNLSHYLALRRRDLRDLQNDLQVWGLSSLGQIEAQVLPTLETLIATLSQLVGAEECPPHPNAEEFLRGSRQLERESLAVLGPLPAQRRVRIMVTLPSEAAERPDLIPNLLAKGMNIARINCAHDSPEVWLKMIQQVRALDSHCKIAMDLGGPKVRTQNLMIPKGYLFRRGDGVLLTANPQKKWQERYPLQIGCSLPLALSQVEVGQRIWFDDGKIGGVIVERVAEGLLLEISQAALEGDKLKADKGINFPDTDLLLDPLTPKDLADLDFVVQQADIINYSFVQTAEDMRRLSAEITARQPQRPLAIVAKIETAAAVRHLPELIVTAGSQYPIGVMIARGDLAVEIGFERLAEMQEQILWICEAAHVPVIWATQVLENLAKTGRPSRAEVTDAAMSERAECVMLNKGPYILDAITILDHILIRMEDHQSKKVARLRALRSWA